MPKSTYTVKFSGESGQGINSTGEIFAYCLKDLGYFIYGYREYPSLIEGGNASYQIDISNESVNFASELTDVLIALSRFSIYEYLKTVKPGGKIFHSLHNVYFSPEQRKIIEDNQLEITFIDAEQYSVMRGGGKKGTNVVLLALLWNSLNLPKASLTKRIEERFGKYEALFKADMQIIDDICRDKSLKFDFGFTVTPSRNSQTNDLLISGNEALALGALSARVRAIYAYPMTPATSIYKYLADTSPETGIVAKQVEDEITAVQISIGSMFMGTRAFTTTSGGGFDLMTESISFAGMAEIPLVIVLAQRPGPSTGLPTWSGAGDLDVAVYSGHGDFPRIVLSVSDALSAYTKVQEAFNLAEKYQLPVILLTEKNIAESLYQIDKFPKALPIVRSLVAEDSLEKLAPEDRYKLSVSGVSPRWLPGQMAATYKVNSDEHTFDGDSTEDAEVTKSMMDKRLQKLETVLDELPEPTYYGEKEPDICLVGWGSTLSIVSESISKLSSELGLRVGYYHYEYLFPAKIPETLLQLSHNKAKKVILVEQNATGQLGKLLSAHSDISFTDKLLKYDGRPFYYSDIKEFLINSISK